MKLLYSLFLPKDVLALLNTLESLDPLFRQILFYSEIKSQVIKIIKDPRSKNEIDRSLNKERISKENICFYLLEAESFKRLSMGNYHVYRGVLNLQGNDYRSIFLICVKELKERGFYSDEIAREEIENMSQAVKEVG